MESVRLKCKTCGEYHDINKNTPVEFENWAYSKVEWSDFKDSVPPLSEEHWSRSETLPCVGETRTNYNWSNGFDEPKAYLANPNCSLMMLFMSATCLFEIIVL